MVIPVELLIVIYCECWTMYISEIEISIAAYHYDHLCLLIHLYNIFMITHSPGKRLSLRRAARAVVCVMDVPLDENTTNIYILQILFIISKSKFL